MSQIVFASFGIGVIYNRKILIYFVYMQNWKLERDKLVDGLEGIMKKQQKEIHDLKKQKSELEDKQTSRHRHVGH